MTKIKHIMTSEVVTVRADTPISEVTELLMKNNITGLPVVDEDMTLVGVITEKDVLKVFYSSGHVTNRVARDFMTSPAVHFDQEQDVRSVCDCLMKNFFRRVPVTSGGRVVGIVSRHDVLWHVYKGGEEQQDPQDREPESAAASLAEQ